jgi:hypothetical protein
MRDYSHRIRPSIFSDLQFLCPRVSPGSVAARVVEPGEKGQRRGKGRSFGAGDVLFRRTLLHIPVALDFGEVGCKLVIE